MIKLFVTDVDGTLFSDDGTICEKNIIAINKMINKGVNFAISSGRGMFFIDDILDILNLRKEHCYSVLCNGSLIMKNIDETIIDKSNIDFSIVNKVFNTALKYNLSSFIFTPNTTYFHTLDEEEYNFINRHKRGSTILNTNDIGTIKHEDIVKIAIKSKDMNFLRKKELEILNGLDPSDIEITYSSNKYMEVNSKNCNKGIALEKLCKLLNIDIKDTLSIGDSFNDIEMLKKAGIGICVKNSHSSIQNIANYITTLDNNEGAVAEAIEKFVFNN